MLKKILLANALFATLDSVCAQTNAPFGVRGSITPPAAIVFIANNGSVILGAAAATDVKAYSSSRGTNDFYLFPVATLAYIITFPAPAKAALSFVDNNSGKVLLFNTFDSIRFGLVDVVSAGSKTVGSVAVTLTDTLINNSPVSVFFSAPNGTTTWSTTTVGGKTGLSTNNVAPGYTNAFAKTAGATAPESFTNFSGNLSMVLSLSKALVDNNNTGITATGSGTFTVVYL